MIPLALKKISQQISNHKIKLSAYSTDGRINSIQSEKKVIQFIKSLKGWTVTSPKSRSWYDIKINDFYCNIKISNMTSNDNTVGKSVIHYFITGLHKAPNSYKKCFESMKKNENPSKSRDYYFIVIRKTDHKCFVISFKNLKVKIAPNNPPFQCDWSENIKQNKRSWLEAKKYFIKKWAESLIKRHEQQIALMKKYYPEVFNK